MEDYIYILIGVIWLAAGIYKASKKKKTQAVKADEATPAAGQTSAVPKVKSLLEQILADQGIKVPEPVEYSEETFEETEKVEAAGRFQSEYTRLGFSALERVSAEGVSSTNRISFTDHMKLNKQRPKRPIKIDLRKAIIYQAILERPYP
jgi:hypothetical protein